MYKLCVALAAMLAVAAAKPSLGYTYGSYVAPVATSYSAYSAPVYSAPVYSNYAGVSPVAPVHTTYAAAPVAAVATAPVAAVATAPVAAVAPVHTTYSAATYPAAYPAAYPAYSGYSSYSAPLTYTNEVPTSFLWKKK